MNVDDILAPSYKPRLAQVNAGASSEIPVIDVSAFLAGEPGALETTAIALRRALEDIGFYFIVGHGVPTAQVENMFAGARAFFGRLSLAEKMGLQLNSNLVGYTPIRAATHNLQAHQVKPNLVESFWMMHDLTADHPDVVAERPFRGLVQWPSEQAVPGFRETANAYMRAMRHLGTSLLPLYASALELPLNWFDRAFVDPMGTLRISHYPQQEPSDSKQFGLQPHTDTSFMTLLPNNKVPGLSVRLPTGEWIDAPSVPGSFLVNTGDMLQRWSNNRLRSAPHKVVNVSGDERFAIPYFMDCNYDWKMECLPTCHSEQRPAQYEPITFPEYITAFREHGYKQAIQKT